MRWSQFGVLVVVAGMAASAHAQVVDSVQVRNWAAACAGCHGTTGIAEAGNESLAGVNKEEMLKKLIDFKTGKKPATIMHQLAKGYSDEQLAALATYSSALKK